MMHSKKNLARPMFLIPSLQSRASKLTGLAHEITGVKVAQKKGKQTVSLKLTKKEEKTWHKVLDDASTKEAVADDNSNTNITSQANDAE